MPDQPTVTVNLPITPELIEALAPAVAAVLELQQPAEAEWLDVSEAAEYLRCGERRIYNLVSQRAIPFHKEGSRVLLRRSELRAFIEAGGAKRAA